MDYVQSENLNTPHAFFTRRQGLSEGLFASLNCAHGTGDKQEHVDKNFRRIASHFNAKFVLKAYQFHSNEVVVATSPWELETRPKADAIVTKMPGLVIGITTADCAPVLFADTHAGIIAAAHAGWKGALAGIIENTIATMEQLGGQKSRISAAIGPCIQQNSYEVGAEFHLKFMDNSPDFARFFRPSARDKHFMFNLSHFVADRLKKAGVENVNLLANDTYLEEDAFFSYRRTTKRGEAHYGCQFSAIMLE